MTLVNQGVDPAIVHLENGSASGKNIPMNKNDQIVESWIVESDSPPKSYIVTAKSSETNKDIKVNGDSSFELKPKQTLSPTTVAIGKYFIYQYSSFRLAVYSRICSAQR